MQKSGCYPLTNITLQPWRRQERQARRRKRSDGSGWAAAAATNKATLVSNLFFLCACNEYRGCKQIKRKRSYWNIYGSSGNESGTLVYPVRCNTWYAHCFPLDINCSQPKNDFSGVLAWAGCNGNGKIFYVTTSVVVNNVKGLMTWLLWHMYPARKGQSASMHSQGEPHHALVANQFARNEFQIA